MKGSSTTVPTPAPVESERKYTTISIPSVLYRKVDSLLDNPEFNPQGYRSVTEYLTDLIRSDLTKAGALPAKGR